MTISSVLAFLRKELEEIIPPTVFFAVGFNLILLTTNLILGEYNLHFSSVLLATTGALIIGKAVLVANALPYFRRIRQRSLDPADPVQERDLLRGGLRGALPREVDRVPFARRHTTGHSPVYRDKLYMGPVFRNSTLDPCVVPALHIHR